MGGYNLNVIVEISSFVKKPNQNREKTLIETTPRPFKGWGIHCTWRVFFVEWNVEVCQHTIEINGTMIIEINGILGSYGLCWWQAGSDCRSNNAEMTY